MLDNFSMPPEVLSAAGFELSVNDVPVDEFAQNWVDNNGDVVLSWLTGE